MFQAFFEGAATVFGMHTINNSIKNNRRRKRERAMANPHHVPDHIKAERWAIKKTQAKRQQAQARRRVPGRYQRSMAINDTLHAQAQARANAKVAAEYDRRQREHEAAIRDQANQAYDQAYLDHLAHTNSHPDTVEFPAVPPHLTQGQAHQPGNPLTQSHDEIILHRRYH